MSGYISSDERGKKKSTIKITLFSKDLCQSCQRNEKLDWQVITKRIQHHQTSFITNSRGTSLGGKTQEGKIKGLQKQTQRSEENSNRKHTYQ